jgi:uncharacterized RDD family membrane protein YckC
MKWFYAEAGQQKGPVTDEQFDTLVREGVIQSATLVWREGMAGWEPLASVRAGLPPRIDLQPPTPPTRPGEVTCVECGRPFPAEETVRVGATSVCAACKPVYVQKLREGKAAFVSAPPASMHYAGFWIRAGAYMIDQLIMMIVGMPLSIWFGLRMQQAIQGGRIDWEMYMTSYAMLSGISMLLSLLYNVLLVGRYAGTPGKLILKIKIVTAEGERVSYLRALGRFGGHIVSGFTCMIGYLLPIWDKEKRALHDYICHTRVIYK